MEKSAVQNVKDVRASLLVRKQAKVKRKSGVHFKGSIEEHRKVTCFDLLTSRRGFRTELALT